MEKKFKYLEDSDAHVKAEATNTKAKIKWHLRGLYLDSCNCDWGCPCQFNANPTHGNCEGLSAIHITEGKYGDVKLDRLNFIWIVSWPRITGGVTFR